MTEQFEKILSELTPIQMTAVNWADGPALVLAGPGAGKTRVLTTRIARILNDSRDRNFRILALTFTTKAATEMRDRVEVLVPGMAERTFIGTFHSFCTEILRLHGSHVGIQPDFGIYDQDSDREALLFDALRDESRIQEEISKDDVRWLNVIDQLKARLILPEKVGENIKEVRTAQKVAMVYQVYENALKARHVMDFNGLILETCRLIRDFPEVSARIRRTYPYWLIDEFQDTSPAQTKLVRLLAGEDFRNLFVVADDDQIIYQWAGASYRQIELFRERFQPELIQLVENRRCPPEIVESANLLVAFNTQRTPNKKPQIAARSVEHETIVVRSFGTDVEERESIIGEIAKADRGAWGKTAVLGRTRTLLTPILEGLKHCNVPAVLAQRRDRFISPQFVWLQEVLDQCLRPTDKQVFAIMVNAANRFTGLQIDPLIVMAEAQAEGKSYFERWGQLACATGVPLAEKLGTFALKLAQARSQWRKTIKDIIPVLLSSTESANDVVRDVDDDHAAWNNCVKEMRAEKGEEPELAEFIQGLALRSKEPPRDPSAVSILTVHAAKGLEFDTVYLVGLIESILPSWQSIKAGVASPEMEEERRNCFVAITRTRERLLLSWASKYGTWAKEPSRFLKEMRLI